MDIVNTIFLFIKLLFLNATSTQSNDSNEITTIQQPSKKITYYWNIPTFQCKSHKLNFTDLAAKFQIKQNHNDTFYHGNAINILYDPGNFPAILHDAKTGEIFLRNGGLPQLGNLSLHLSLFADIVDKLIPEQFAGLAIVDFESWRPIFRQNFGTLQPYRDISIETERKNHPLWPRFLAEIEARKKFEFHARKFMEETILFARELRPNATWGYYAYPYCFNMSPSNMRTECPREVQQENNELQWLYKASDNFHPSLYLSQLRLSAKEKVDMIEGRILEAHRLGAFLGERKRILPYLWYKYLDTQNFLSKEDLFMSFLALSTLEIDGVVIWGASNDVNTKQKCLDLYNYIDQVLGPALLNNFA